jgi:hypothetical protein
MIAVHDTQSGSHDFLTKFWFRALLNCLMDMGVPVKLIANLDQAQSDTVVTDCDFLDPQTVNRLKNNGCKVVGFNMVDSSYLSQACRENPLHIDLIFSLTGIQKTNVGQEFIIDKEFNVTLEDREFLPPEQWERFDQMRREGRLLSLPYTHWEAPPAVPRPTWEDRANTVLIRGGAHFRRVVLALFLIRAGRLDSRSGFPLKDYFAETMNPQFRFCKECQLNYWGEQRYRHHEVTKRPNECNSPAVWGGELDLGNMGHWNNRCPASFYWLARKFSERHGEVSPTALETIFNAKWESPETALRMLSQVRFTSDLKWLHSIYAAQRFWDAASVGTVNLLPSRTNDQEYFPHIADGEHYLTFKEDFTDLEQPMEISKELHEHIAANCYNLYSQWIRPDKYLVNTNLLQWVIYRILQ